MTFSATKTRVPFLIHFDFLPCSHAITFCDPFLLNRTVLELLFLPHNRECIIFIFFSFFITLDRTSQRHSQPTPSISAHAHLDSPSRAALPQVPTRNTSSHGMPNQSLSTNQMSTAAIVNQQQAFATSSRVRGLNDASNHHGDCGQQVFLPSRLVATEGRKRGGAKGKTILDPRFEEPVQLSDLSHLTPSRLALANNNGTNGHGNGTGAGGLVSLDRRIMNPGHRNSTGSDRTSSSTSSSGLERKTLLRNAAAAAAASGQTSIFGFPATGTNQGHLNRDERTPNGGQEPFHNQSCPRSLLVSPALTQRSMYAQQLIEAQLSHQARPQSSSGSIFCTTSRGWTKDDFLYKFGADKPKVREGSSKRDSAQAAGSEFAFVCPAGSPLSTLPAKSKGNAFYNRPLPPTPSSEPVPPRPPLPRESSLSRHAQTRQGQLTRLSSSSSVFLPRQVSLEESANSYYHPSLARGSSRFENAEIVPGLDVNQIRGPKERLLFMLGQKDAQPVHFGSCSNVRPSSYNCAPPQTGESFARRSSGNAFQGAKDDATSSFGDQNFDELIRKLKLNQEAKRAAQEKQLFASASTTSTPNHKHAHSFFGPISFGTGSRRDFQMTGYDGRPYERSSFPDADSYQDQRMYQTEGRGGNHDARAYNQQLMSAANYQEARQKSLDPDYDAFTSAASPARAPRKGARMNRILEKNCVQYSN